MYIFYPSVLEYTSQGQGFTQKLQAKCNKFKRKATTLLKFVKHPSFLNFRSIFMVNGINTTWKQPHTNPFTN